MPFVHVAPPPGMFRNGTRYQSAGRWYDGNLVRWHEGAMRPVGGWERFGDGSVQRENLLARSYEPQMSPWTDNFDAEFASRTSHFGLNARLIRTP